MGERSWIDCRSTRCAEWSLSYVESLIKQNDLLRDRLSSSVEAFQERSDTLAGLQNSLENEKR